MLLGAAVDSLVGTVVGAGIKRPSTHPNRTVREPLQAIWLRWTDYAAPDGLADFYRLRPWPSAQSSKAARASPGWACPRRPPPLPFTELQCMNTKFANRAPIARSSCDWFVIRHNIA